MSEERMVVIGRMLASCAPKQDADLALDVYLEETEDIPLPLLRQSCRILVRQTGRIFAPTVGEIRNEVCRQIRNLRRVDRGMEPLTLNQAKTLGPLDAEVEMRWFREHGEALLSGADLKRLAAE